MSNHRIISEPTMRGWSAVAFGASVFVVAGYVTCTALGFIRGHHTIPGEMRLPASLFGAVFSTLGLAISFYGLRGVVADNAAQAKRGAGAQPWVIDYPWDPEGTPGTVGSELWKNFVSLVVITLFMSPFHLFLLSNDPGKILIVFIFSIIDFVLAVIWLTAIYDFIRFLRYGNSYLKFNHFPYFLGKELKASLILPKTAQGLRAVKVVLRAVQEKTEFRRHGRHKQEEVVVYETYAQTTMLSEAGDAAKRGEPIPLSFKLPEGRGAETTLSQNPARYWEIEVSGKLPGVDYLTCFLVPVYARAQ